MTLRTIFDVKNLAILFLTLILGTMSLWSEVRLSEVWPESISKGRFDDLELRYQVNQRLVLLVNSPWCMVDGIMVELPSPPRRLGMDWWVPEFLVSRLNLPKSIPSETIRAPAEIRWVAPPVVVIDPGHGGKDPGAIGIGGMREKDVVLDVSKRVVALLSRKNIVVRLTRDNDEFVDLHERGEMSNRWRASVFVSIHANSHSSRDMEGYQLFRQSDDASIQSRANFVKIRFPLSQYLPTPVSGKQKAPSSHEQLFIWKDRESKLLSDDLQQQLAYRRSSAKTQPQKNLCVLRETMAPSVLVEIDFVSNPSVEYKMGTNAWREKMATDIVNGILSYLGIGPQS